MPTQGHSDLVSQRCSGKAGPHLPLALSMSEQTKSNPLSWSGVEKCREAPRTGSRSCKHNSSERIAKDYREQIKLAPPIYALYLTLIFGGSKLMEPFHAVLDLAHFNLSYHLSCELLGSPDTCWGWMTTDFQVFHQGYLWNPLICYEIVVPEVALSCPFTGKGFVT